MCQSTLQNTAYLAFIILKNDQSCKQLDQYVFIQTLILLKRTGTKLSLGVGGV